MGEKRKILVVDDDIEIVKILKTALERYGYKVITGYNGKEAIALSREHHPDLILMDIVMPEIDGLKACEVIKQSETPRFIPVIFLTGRGSPGDKVKGLDLGADDYLVKPFSIKELAARVRSMLRIKKLTDQLQEIRQELIDAKQVAAVAATVVTLNHNINTPLTTIMAKVEVIKTKIPSSASAECQPCLDEIMKAAKKIGNLIKNLAALEKPNFADYLPGTSMIELNVKT